MGRDITRCSEAELRELKAELDRQYAGYVAQNLKLDMSRGKPSGTQLNLTNGILDKLDNYLTSDGVDARNYGGLEGFPRRAASSPSCSASTMRRSSSAATPV